MGILELHFHDPQFDFSPSMSTGGGDSSIDEDSDDGQSLSDWRTDSGSDTDDESSRKPGLGAFVALAVLVALAGLAGLKRRGGGDAADSEDADAVELEA